MRTTIAVTALILSLAFAAAGDGSSRRPELAYVAGTAAFVPKVWLANADGTRAHMLGTGESALLSPNGMLVAATPWGFAGPGVMLFSPTGAVKGRFFDASKAGYDPEAWSPDSRYLAVAVSGTQRPIRPELLVIDTRTGRSVMLAHGGIAGVSFAPALPDRLVYSRSASVDYKPPVNLFIATATGGSIRQLTHDAWSADPVWGARGIAYNHAPGPHPATAFNQVYVIQPDGTHRTQITNFTSPGLAYGLTPLQFAADGRRLLAEYNGGSGTSQTWTIDISTRRARRLTIHGQPVTPDALSEDGKLVLVEAQQPQALNDTIETIPFSGGAAQVLAQGGSPSWNR